NVYGVLGAGQSELSGTPEASGFSLVQFDIEDRKYYFLAKYADLYNENKSDLRQATLRAGIAPYIEKYDGIHSWFILEWHQFRFSSSDSSEDLTPLLRI